jgi:putative peptidoglycan lipid II flippase
LIAGGTLLSRILGLLRDMAMAAFFDRAVTDAWTVAFRIPNFFRRLMGEGSFGASLIPVFTRWQAGRKELQTESQRFAVAVIQATLLLFSLLTLAAVVAAEPLLRFLLKTEYVMGPRWELTLQLSQIMLAFIFLITQYSLLTSLLHSMGQFLWPSVAPCLFNIALIVSCFLPKEGWHFAYDYLAWGVVAGGLMQVIILMPSIVYRGFLKGFLRWNWNAEIKKSVWLVYRNLLPSFLGTGLFQFLILLNLYFASSLAVGTISYFYWADRLLEFPLSLISVSLSSALLPSLSQHYQAGRWAQVTKELKQSLLTQLALCVPASLGLFLLARPIVILLFKRGEFTDTDAAGVASILQIYALILLVAGLSRVLVTLFFATHKAR